MEQNEKRCATLVIDIGTSSARLLVIDRKGVICTKFPAAYDCSAKIAKFILQQMKVQPNMEEIAYMTLNINRAMRDK